MSAVIHGTVFDAAGSPVASARVYFISGPGNLPEVAALTDAAGRFALAAPQPGTYRIGCASDADGAADAEVPVGTAEVVIDLRLRG